MLVDGCCCQPAAGHPSLVSSLAASSSLPSFLQIWPGHLSDPYDAARKQAAAAAATGAASPGTAPAGSAAGASAAGGGGGKAALGQAKRGSERLEAAMGEELEPPTPALRAQLDREAEQALLACFAEFFTLYGYS